MNIKEIMIELKAVKESYEEILNRIEEEIEQMPEGGLSCKRIGRHTYFYHYTKSEDGKGIQRYLPKEEEKFAATLKRKRFLQLSIKRLRIGIKAIGIFLKTFLIYDPDEILAELPVAFRCQGYKTDSSGDDMDWANVEYEKNEMYKDRLVYGTVGGLMVRSKSEAIIVGLLEGHNIPFRYEAALKLGGTVYYPDFTILRPRDKKILYWEHFGMMDDEEYALRAEHKLAMYRKNSIFPWNQLISTYETAKTPLDARDIQSIIKAFLL